MGTANQGWQYQGRQEHGWFGHGTGPGSGPSPPGGGASGLGTLDDRAGAVSRTAFMALPRSLHSMTGSLYEAGYAARLQTLLLRWAGAPRLSDEAFARHFFGREANDGTVRALRSATGAIVAARTQADLRTAAEQVAVAMQAVGLGNWGRFLADAQAHADSPATRAAVAASQPPSVVTPPIINVAAPVTPVAPATPPPAPAAEPEHGAIWQWLHGLGLTETRHEQATALRRVMGPQGGLVYRRDGVPLNVDQMSDDEVLALDKETRKQRHTPPLVGAAAPVTTPWGWEGSPPYIKAYRQLQQPGTHESVNGRVPTREQAERMIRQFGGKIERIEEGHSAKSVSSHRDPHINYTLPGGRKLKATVIVQPWK